jgi:hypothetical protein
MTPVEQPIVVVPLKDWTLVSQKAIRFALSFSDKVYAVHVDPDEGEPDELEPHWTNLVVKPLQAAGRPVPTLVRVPSPFRRFIRPILDEVLKLTNEFPHRPVLVVVPELVVSGAFEWLLHNQRANMLKAALPFSGSRRVVVLNVPWYLDDSK